MAGVLMDLDTIAEKLEQAKKEGKDPIEYLKDLSQAEKKEGESLVRVQVMPGNAIAGYGRFPAIVDMPKAKAEDLAKYGKVSIIDDYSDVIQATDTEKINQLLEETVAIRKSIGGGKQEGLRESILVKKRSSSKTKAKKSNEEEATTKAEASIEDKKEEAESKTTKKPFSRRTNV